MFSTLFGMLGGPFGAIGGWIWNKIGPYLIAAGVIGLIVLGAYLYIKHTNATIDTLKADVVQQQLRADTLELTNANMQKQYDDLKNMTDKFNADWAKLLSDKNKSQTAIAKRDYKKEAISNSKKLSDDLNNSWATTFKDLQDLSNAKQ